MTGGLGSIGLEIAGYLAAHGARHLVLTGRRSPGDAAQRRIEALRETMKSVVESKMLMESMRQNDVMRRLAAWAAMLAVPTMVAGIYGMNFEVMPELKWHYGYFAVVGLMFTVCLILYWRFKKSGWL